MWLQMEPGLIRRMEERKRYKTGKTAGKTVLFLFPGSENILKDWSEGSRFDTYLVKGKKDRDRG